MDAYKWNQSSDAAPLCAVIEQMQVERVNAMLEEIGASKTLLVNYREKFELSTLAGFTRSHIEVWNTGKATVNWSKEKGGLDFKSNLLDLSGVAQRRH